MADKIAKGGVVSDAIRAIGIAFAGEDEEG